MAAQAGSTADVMPGLGGITGRAGSFALVIRDPGRSVFVTGSLFVCGMAFAQSRRLWQSLSPGTWWPAVTHLRRTAFWRISRRVLRDSARWDSLIGFAVGNCAR